MSYLQIARFSLTDISSIDIITEEMKLDNIVYFPKFIESEIYYHPLIFWKKKIITTTYNNAIVSKEYTDHDVVDEGFFVNRDVEFLKIKKWMTGGKFSIDGKLAIKKSPNKVVGKDYYPIYLVPQICIHYDRDTSNDLFFFDDKSELLEFLNDLKREAEEKTTLSFSVGTINGDGISGIGNLKNLIDKIITIND